MKKIFLNTLFLFTSHCFINAMEQISEKIEHTNLPNLFDTNNHNSHIIEPYLTEKQCQDLDFKCSKYEREAEADLNKAMARNLNYSFGEPLKKLQHYLDAPYLNRLPAHEKAEKVVWAKRIINYAYSNVSVWCNEKWCNESREESKKDKEDKEKEVKELDIAFEEWYKHITAFFLYVAKEEYPNLPQDISFNQVFSKLYQPAAGIKARKSRYLNRLTLAKNKLAKEHMKYSNNNEK